MPVREPVFGLGIQHISGPLVSGPNTRDTGDIPAVLIGSGTVEITIRDLPLLPGTYDLSASVWDFPILHAYDQRSRVMRFDVLPGDRMEGFGLVTLRPEWSIVGRRHRRRRRPPTALAASRALAASEARPRPTARAERAPARPADPPRLAAADRSAQLVPPAPARRCARRHEPMP